MAYIRKRGRNSYLIAVYLGRDSKGKRRWHYETFYGTEKQAEHRKAELEVKYRRPSGPRTAAMTMGEYLERWLDNTEGTVAESTLETYALHVRHLTAAVGEMPLYGLTGFDLKTRLKDYFREYVKTRPLSPATIKGIYGTFRTALRQAKADGVIADDLAASLKAPRVPHKERRVLTPEELVRLLEAAKGYKHYLVIRLLALTGMRLGEVLGLRWQDVDLERGVLTVRQSVNVRRRKPNDRPKTEASVRQLALDQETVTLLAAHRREQEKNRVVALQGLVFSATDGRPLREMAVRRTFWRVLNRARLAHIRVHDLRHTAGSILLDTGVPLATVAAFLGHSTPATTAAVYSHPVRKGASLAEVLPVKPFRKET